MLDRNFWIRDFNDDKIGEVVSLISKAMQEDSLSDIVINIQSYGGSIDSLNLISGYLATIPCRIVTICHGMAMSCGFMLLIQGTKGLRFCFPSSIGLYHEISTFEYGKISEIKDSVKYLDYLTAYYTNLIVSKTNITEDDIKKLIKTDAFLSPTTMKRLGIVDHVLDSNISFDKEIDYGI